MAECRAATKGRRMGSSRRKQLHEGSGEALAAVPGPSEEPPWASEIVKRVQDFFREQDKDHEGFVTRSDMEKLQEEDFPCSMEELKLVFDGLDAAGTGRLSTEEFTAGLRQFLNSQKAARDHRRRKTASRRVRLVLPNLTLEGADSEERRHFAAFVDQLGTDNISEEQEIWQLWVKLRQDEPQLLGNLEDFLAKMRHRIQEARSKKEALEVTLNKRVVEHDKEVQQLCEALEQQIKQEQQRLQQESMTRSHQHSAELQRVLDASEREVQRLVTAQMELETRCRSLRSTQQATSTENRQLEESNRVLEDRLQHLHQQLQQTHRHLQTARASVVWEHREEPGDRAVAELPGEMPLSPQMSPGKSEKYDSEMRIRLGSQSGEPKAKSTHQVVWEVPPAEINILGAPMRVNSAEEDPFPEFLKEEHFSDQSSLLREMNDAIAALSKQLKPQASGAPPDAAHDPRDDAEPQMGPEAATAHGTTPSVLQETLPGHISHELVEGDLKERLVTAELRAPDVTQAGASVGARHHRAQEPGAEQGESPEEARRMLFLQGKGAGVKELMLKVAEHPQGAPGESTEAGEKALLEVEGEGWMQEKTGWEKAQPPGEAEEAALSQGENLEAGLGPPEAGDTGLAAGWQFVTDEPGPAAALGERAQPLGTGLGEEAEPPSGLSEELEVKPGERLEPEPPSRGEARMGAAEGDGDCHPEVTVAPDPTMLGEEHISADVQHWGETLDTDELPAQAQHGGSRRAGAKEGEVEATQPREADPQRQGESARGEAAWGGTVGAEVPAAVPLADMWEGGAGTDVQLLEAHSSDANMQLLAEMEAALQPLSKGGSPGMGQAGSVDPDVQPLEEVDKPELGLGEEMGAAAVHGEGPSPGEPSAGSPDVCGLFPVMAQALELVEPEDSQADVQLCGGISLETSHGGGDHAATQRMQDSEEGTQGHEERGLPHEPVLHPHGVTIRQGEGAGTGVQPQGEAESLDMLEDQGTDANVQLTAEADEVKLTPGGSTEAEHTQRRGEDGDGAQGQGEHELPHEPVLNPQGVGVGQGEGADAGVQPWEGAESLAVLEDQGSAANVQLNAEADELRLTPGGSTEAVLQPLSEAGSPGTEQGGSLDPDVQPLDQVDQQVLVELEIEDAQADTQLRGSLSPEPPQGGQRGAATQHEDEDEDGAQGQGEHELPHEPVLDAQGARVGQGEGADAGVQPWEGAECLAVLEEQSTAANVQLTAEVDELRLTPGGSMEAVLQPLSEAGSPGTEQGGSLDPDVQPLVKADKPELVEMVEAEESQADRQLCEHPSLETPQGGEDHAATQHGDEDEDEDGTQGQGEHELPHEPVLNPQGLGIRQGEGADAGVIPREEAESLDTLEEQGTAVNVQLSAEIHELKLTPGGSTGTALQSLRETDSLGTEQGGSVAPDFEPLYQIDKPELVEVESEDTRLCEHPSQETLQGGGHNAATQIMMEADGGAQGHGERGLPHGPELHPHGVTIRQGEGAGTGVQPWKEAESLDMLEDQGTDANVQLTAEADEVKLTPGGSTEAEHTQRRGEDGDGAQGQGEHELPHEPVLNPQGVGVGQGEGADAGVQPWEGAESLAVLEDQGSAANVQLNAEADELRLTPGGSTEAVLQPLSEAGSPGTEQGGSLDPDVQPLDQVDQQVLVELEIEDAQADTQLRGSLSPEPPQGGQRGAATQHEDEDEDGAQGQGEHELPHEPVLDAQGARVGQGEGADAGVQPWEGAECLAVLEEQSTAANVQLTAEVDELRLTPGGSMEAVLQPLSEAGSPGTEQGGSLDPDVQPLVKADKPELVEMVEAEESQADRQLCEHPSLETPQGGEDHAATQHGDEDEDEDGTQGQGEHELPHEPVLNPQGLGIRQGEGADAGVIPREEAESLDTLEEQGTAVNVQLSAEIHELKLTPGGSTGTALQSLRETDSLGTEQGGSVAPDFEPLYQIDKPELVEVESEDTRLCEHPSQETLQGGGHNAATQIMMEADGGAQGHGERGLPHGPELHPHGVTIRQGEGAGTGVQPWKEAESLDMLEDQGTDANVQLTAEADEVKLTPGGSTEAEHTQRRGEDGDGAQGQGEHELPHEPVLNPQGVGVGQGEGADAGVQPWEGAESLAVLEDQGSAANVQLNAEADELRLTPGGSTEAVLQPLSEAGSPGTEQGGSLDPDVQPLDQVDQQVLVELEIEDAQADTQLRGSLSPEPPQGGQRGAATQHEDEDEDGAQGQGEHELPHEPVLDAQGARVGQGEGADAGVQPWEGAECLAVLEEQSTAANVQLTAEVEESGGSAEADLAPLGAAGMREGEQSQTPVSEAALCAPHTADAWEKAAGAHVSPLAEVTVHPESATAAEVPGLEAKLGALTGPDGQILEDTQPLELPQGEGDAVEGRPLGGAEGLEVVQGERLEAWARSLVEAQGPGIKQGYDDRVSALASPVSEMPLQISTLKLETMMQEDVLVPDVRRLGASGQAAQSELQEQVSAQADKVRLHTASQPPEEKPPHVMETEQVAAGPAEPPQQEVPPVSTLQMKVQQEEDAGNSQLGVVLKDSSLGDAANSSTQPQRQLLGELREDLNVGQQEKQQEVGRKTTQKGEPSPREPGAVTTDGAGPAPRGSAEACLDPDHLYNVLFVGNSHVGKTSFLYRLHANAFNPHLTTTVGLDYQVTMLVVDNKRFALRLWDSAGTERYHSITKQFFRKADGVVLMYDITSEHSFSDVRYWLSCIQEGAKDRVAILLLGNKTDCAAERRVPTKEGERLAKEHQLMFYECSAASGHNVSESMVSLIRLLKVCEDKLKTEAEEVPKPPQKKKGCC